VIIASFLFCCLCTRITRARRPSQVLPRHHRVTPPPSSQRQFPGQFELRTNLSHDEKSLDASVYANADGDKPVKMAPPVLYPAWLWSSPLSLLNLKGSLTKEKDVRHDVLVPPHETSEKGAFVQCTNSRCSVDRFYTLKANRGASITPDLRKCFACGGELRSALELPYVGNRLNDAC